MKEESSSPYEQVKSGFWKGIGGAIGTGLVYLIWELLIKYTKIIPQNVIHWLENLIPTDIKATTISRDLWRSGIILLVVSFVYVAWRENKYVSHMYRKRDALEAGKLKSTDLTLEEIAFIKSHWPHLFPQ